MKAKIKGLKNQNLWPKILFYKSYYVVFMDSLPSGSGPLQWVWLGELIPPEYKVFAGISTSICEYTYKSSIFCFEIANQNMFI